jgi:uncharacterized OsmC-like protein
MALKANDMNINLAGTKIDVTKHMIADPRRIGKIDIVLHFDSILHLEEKDKTILKRVGDNCPVAKSLHPDLEIDITYNW